MAVRIALALVLAMSTTVVRSESSVAPGRVTWRFEIDNDVVFNSDNQFSNGWSLQIHGPLADAWTGARGTPAFGKTVARWFLPDRVSGLSFREGWAIGQNIQTPDDLTQSEPIAGDVPYAASLAAINSWIAFDERVFHGFGWLFGVIGPAAGGEQVQRPYHELIHAPDPAGWNNQLENRPLFNLYYEQRRKLWRHRHVDLAGALALQVGNGITGADVALEARFGRRLPPGFGYTSNPVGRRLVYHARGQALPTGDWALHGSLVAQVSGAAYLAFIDDADDLYRVTRENPVGALILGLHYQRRTWGIHGSLWFSTDTIKPGSAVGETDTANNFGTLMLEFRP